MESHVQEELNKPKLKDFTLEEFTEKMIQYGYLMVRNLKNYFDANVRKVSIHHFEVLGTGVWQLKNNWLKH